MEESSICFHVYRDGILDSEHHAHLALVGLPHLIIECSSPRSDWLIRTGIPFGGSLSIPLRSNETPSP
jgi:hypothetical protein